VADLDDLLKRTSRTFALAIPLLEEPTRREVSLAYLLFRIADTFEDAARWPVALRRACLLEMAALLEEGSTEDPAALARHWSSLPNIHDASCAELVAATPEVLAALDACGPGGAAAVRKHVRRTALGMADVVASCDADGNLAVADLAALKHYCYIVAGIVGELLTELFVLAEPVLRVASKSLAADAALFGEGLQLVNILKDAGGDAVEGRRFLPPGVPLSELFAVARADLVAASRYVRTLHEAGASRGTVAFTSLPVLLAYAALDAVEARGHGAKVPRDEVLRIVAQVDQALDAGASPV